MSHKKILAAIAGVLTCAIGSSNLAQAGDVYKYVDERGATMYTDKPIPGAVLVSTGSQRPAEVTSRNQVSAQAATNAQLTASNQRIAAEQSDSKTAAAVAKDLETSRAERCKKAREVYDSSINSQRLYRQTEDGKREYLTDAELTKQRLDSRKNVDTICGPQG